MSGEGLHFADCLSVLPTMADKSCDHAFLDPPYEAEVHSKGRRIGSSQLRVPGSDWRDNAAGGDVLVKKISYPPITEAQRMEVAAQVARLTRRWILVFCQAEAITAWKLALEAGGAEYKRAGVYWKQDAQPQYNGQMPGVGWEAIVIAHGMPRKGPTRWNAGGKCARWDASADARFGKKLDVDGQKPLHLMRQLTQDFTDPGELILVPYSGNATAEVACVELGRRYIAFENKAEHHERGRKRLVDAKKQEQLFAPKMTQTRLVL